ncbi:MAG: protein TolR [Gammaproteobacteria bacterium]|nr:protein TolR [Gammaproteobacteria bacterium]
MPASRRRPMSEINVVPYIDVMLVLLVIFMAAAPMLAQGIQLDLPREASEPLERSEQDPLIISVQSDGAMYLNVGGDDAEPEQLSLTEMQDRVLKVLQARPSAPVFVRGDTDLPYGTIVNVMTILQQAGAESVGLLTEPPAL